MAEAAESHVNIFKNLEDNLQLVVQQIRDGESERDGKDKFVQDKFWQQLDAVFKALSVEGTKFSLAFSKPPFPNAEECEAMTSSMERLVLQLVSSFYSLPKSQGVTLRKNVRRAVLGVLNSVLALITNLGHLHPGDGDRKLATGVVWKETNCFPSLPKDNGEAVRLTIEQTAGLVNDALLEVDEILSNEGQFDDCFGEEEEEENSDNSDAWTDQDREMVAPVKGLVKTATKLLKKAYEASKAKAKCDTEDRITQLDDLNDCAERLSPAVDNLTSSLYAPVNHTTLKNTAIALSDVIGNMLSVLRHSHITEEGDSKWLDFLHKASTHNLTTLIHLLNK